MSKSADHFSADHLTEDLRGRSVRGAAIMFSANAGRIFIGIASAAALGRLLDPEDFGLVAMIAAITALFDRVRTVGLGAPTVQRASINHQQVSNLFWINAVFGLLMTIAFAALAPALHWFYDDGRVVSITLALSLSFFVTGLTVQHGALLRRQMRFRSIGIVDLLSEVIAVAAAIAAAIAGAEYWSLVVLNLTTLVVRLVGTVVACRWLPALPRRGAGIRSMLIFGGQITTSAFVQSIVDRLDRILIGKFVDSTALGYYTRAFFVLIIPINRFHGALRSITVPSLSRIQDDPGRYRFFFRQAAQLTSILLLPAVALSFVAAESLALTLLGPKWGGSVPIIRAFAPGALVAAFGPVLSWVYFSLGRGDRLMRWTIFESIVTVCAILFGLQWGAIGVAVGYSAARVVLWPASVSYCFSGTFVRWRDLGTVMWRPAVATFIAAVGTFLALLKWGDNWHPATQLVGALALFSCLYGVSTIALPGGVAMIREMFHLRSEFQMIGPKKTNTNRQNQSSDDATGV